MNSEYIKVLPETKEAVLKAYDYGLLTYATMRDIIIQGQKEGIYV